MWWCIFLFWSLGCEKEGAILTIMFSGYIFMTLLSRNFSCNCAKSWSWWTQGVPAESAGQLAKPRRRWPFSRVSGCWLPTSSSLPGRSLYSQGLLSTYCVPISAYTLVEDTKMTKMKCARKTWQAHRTLPNNRAGPQRAMCGWEIRALGVRSGWGRRWSPARALQAGLPLGWAEGWVVFQLESPVVSTGRGWRSTKYGWTINLWIPSTET